MSGKESFEKMIGTGGGLDRCWMVVFERGRTVLEQWVGNLSEVDGEAVGADLMTLLLCSWLDRRLQRLLSSWVAQC